MKELTVVTHVTYTYETSDGREFEDECEARQWESQLSLLDDVIMLDFQYEPIKDSESAYYVYAKTEEQAEAFNAIGHDLGYSAKLNGAGYYRYDDVSDSFVNVESEIENLQHILDILKGGEG